MYVVTLLSCRSRHWPFLFDGSVVSWDSCMNFACFTKLLSTFVLFLYTFWFLFSFYVILCCCGSMFFSAWTKPVWIYTPVHVDDVQQPRSSYLFILAWRFRRRLIRGMYMDIIVVRFWHTGLGAAFWLSTYTAVYRLLAWSYLCLSIIYRLSDRKSRSFSFSDSLTHCCMLRLVAHCTQVQGALAGRGFI